MPHRPQRFGRNLSFRRVVAALLLVLTTSLTAYGSDGARRPNVVLILADNVGVGEVGAYGAARGVPTPSLDRLGTEGMRLTSSTRASSAESTAYGLEMTANKRMANHWMANASFTYNPTFPIWLRKIGDILLAFDRSCVECSCRRGRTSGPPPWRS